MDDQHNSNNAANAANNASGQSQQERIVNPAVASPAQSNSTCQKNSSEKKPHKSVGIRIWRSLCRRRKWRKTRKSDSPPINWVEKSTLAVAFLVFGITGIQALIYYWQADLMQKTLVQAQSANRRQLVIATESNQISREALESVQRAFITFDHHEISRSAALGSEEFFYEFMPIFQNSGITPARITAVSIDMGGPHEPTEKQFIGNPNFVPITLGPKALQPIGPKRRFEKEIYGADLGLHFEKLRPGMKPKSFVLWTWMVYRDVFPHTDAHVTEFCEGLTDAFIRQGAINFITRSCGQHNCTDKDCADYDEIVKLAQEGERKETCRHNPALCK